MARKGSRPQNGPYHKVIVKENKAFFFRRKFYSSAKDFSYFSEIGNKEIEKVKEVIASEFPESEYPLNSYKRYMAVIKFLLNPKQKDFTTFDEKILFLIQAMDPGLFIYLYYLSVGYSAYASDEDKDQKEEKLVAFIETVLGTFDVQFLKYEELYLLCILKSEEIVSNVNTDFSSKFFPIFKSVTSLDDVSDNEFRFISQKADYFRSVCEDPYNINTICYNLYNPHSILAMHHELYMLIFFIMIIDPDLEALKIYAEESNVARIRERLLAQFGFYHEDFIKAEEIYRRRFFPERRVSEWGL